MMLKEFERAQRGNTEVRRQVVILLSDGLDATSHLPFEEVMELVRRMGVNVYVIALRGEAARVPRSEQHETLLQADYSLRAVAREAGGRAFFPTTAAELLRFTAPSRRNSPASTNWDMSRSSLAATAPSGASSFGSHPPRMQMPGLGLDTTPNGAATDRSRDSH